MDNPIFQALLGAATGVVSDMGIGGGSLLIILLSSFFGYDQLKAQGINLLYFLPTAVVALIVHLKNKTIDIKTVLWCGICGAAVAAAVSFFVKDMDSGIVKKCFAGLIFLVGLYELFTKTEQ